MDEMDAENVIALHETIEKWKNIAYNGGIDKGSRNCVLCQIYIGRYRCEGCPVRQNTGLNFCEGTPYRKWKVHIREHWSAMNIDPMIYEYKVYCRTCKKIAIEEIEYLKSLLPTST